MEDESPASSCNAHVVPQHPALNREQHEVLSRYRILAHIREDRCRCFRALSVCWSAAREIGWADPTPPKQALEAFYRDEYRAVMGKKTGLDFYRSSPMYVAQVRSQVSWAAAYASGSGTWLDVGAGFGLLLQQVAEVLPSFKRAAVEADPNTRSDLIKSADAIYDDADFWAGSKMGLADVDVLSMSHVLEHLPDPWAALGRARHCLRKAGLLMVEVPNDGYEQCRDPRRASDLPHLWFFSLVGLGRVIEECGFEIVRAAEVGVRRPGVKGPISGRLCRAVRRRLWGASTLLQDPDWYCEGPDRASIRVLARKV